MNSGAALQQRLESARGRPTAVMLIDLQNDYCLADGVFAKAGLTVERLDRVVTSANELAAAARAAGHLVVWVRMVWDDTDGPGLLARRSTFLAEEGLRRGTWGAALLDDLDVRDQDAVVEKTRFGAFHGTELERLLEIAGIEVLVVGGVRTDFCVESTVREAFFRDFEVLVVREAVAGYFEELHEGSLREMGTVFAGVCSLDQALGVLLPE